MIETAARPGTLLRFLRAPWTWSVVCLVGATVVLLATDDFGLPALLLMLVGGWLAGFGFVNAVSRMTDPTGAVVHVIGGVGAGALVFGLVAASGGPLIEGLPDAPRAALIVVQIAAIPAAGWIWLALIGRITAALTKRSAERAPERVVPVWQQDGDISLLRFAAIPLSMRAFATMIVGVVVPLGSAVVALLIAADDLVERLGPRWVIIAVALLLALPGYFVLQHVLRRRTVQAELEISRERLRVDAGAIHLDVALADVDRLVWRTDSDYARCEVHTGRQRVALNAGFARVPADVAPQLPELPRPLRRRLELTGFTAHRSRHGVLVYRAQEEAPRATAWSGRGARGAAAAVRRPDPR